MSYSLGVDLGSTCVAAAVARPTGVEMFTLGERSVLMPAVVFAGEDGTVLTGDTAERRAARHPERVGRALVGRLGDPAPVELGGVPHPVTALLGAQLRAVVQQVTAIEGAQPERIVLTRPAGWDAARAGLVDEIAAAAGVGPVQQVSEPEAAVRHVLAGRLADGDVVAVYDLGGRSLDVTILRRRAGGTEILGTPERVESLGGATFDEAVLRHVDEAAGGALAELDTGGVSAALASARLRQDCVLAKEALSLDTETLVPVLLPSRHCVVGLTRAEFEEMVRASVGATVEALSRALRSAGIGPGELTAVLLVGGSARIPLVAELVSRDLGVPTVVDAHPEYSVALGAASFAAVNSWAARVATGSTVARSTVAVARAAGSTVVQSAPASASPAVAAQAPVRLRDLITAAAPQRSVASAVGAAPARRSPVRLEHLPLAAAVAIALLVLTLAFALAPAPTSSPPPAPPVAESTSR